MFSKLKEPNDFADKRFEKAFCEVLRTIESISINDFNQELVSATNDDITAFFEWALKEYPFEKSDLKLWEAIFTRFVENKQQVHQNKQNPDATNQTFLDVLSAIIYLDRFNRDAFFVTFLSGHKLPLPQGVLFEELWRNWQSVKNFDSYEFAFRKFILERFFLKLEEKDLAYLGIEQIQSEKLNNFERENLLCFLRDAIYFLTEEKDKYDCFLKPLTALLLKQKKFIGNYIKNKFPDRKAFDDRILAVFDDNMQQKFLMINEDTTVRRICENLYYICKKSKVNKRNPCLLVEAQIQVLSQTSENFSPWDLLNLDSQTFRKVELTRIAYAKDRETKRLTPDNYGNSITSIVGFWAEKNQSSSPHSGRSSQNDQTSPNKPI